MFENVFFLFFSNIESTFFVIMRYICRTTAAQNEEQKKWAASIKPKRIVIFKLKSQINCYFTVMFRMTPLSLIQFCKLFLLNRSLSSRLRVLLKVGKIFAISQVFSSEHGLKIQGTGSRCFLPKSLGRGSMV